jgi:hypothetical protein
VVEVVTPVFGVMLVADTTGFRFLRVVVPDLLTEVPKLSVTVATHLIVSPGVLLALVSVVDDPVPRLAPVETFDQA